MAVLTTMTCVEAKVAEPSIAASGTARNKSVLELVRIFKRVLECVTNSESSCDNKNNCFRSLETLIDLGYKAVKERGINSEIETYQRYFQSYIYHSSVHFEKQSQTPLAFDDHTPQMAQSLVDMLLLVVDSFAQLGYPSYYQDFAQAVKMLLECVGGGAGLSQDAARLVQIVEPSKGRA